MTTCTCGPCPIHKPRSNRLEKDSIAPTPQETERLLHLKAKRSHLLTPYIIDLYEGNTPDRGPDKKASIRQIADAMDITYAAVYQRLSAHIKEQGA